MEELTYFLGKIFQEIAARLLNKFDLLEEEILEQLKIPYDQKKDEEKSLAEKEETGGDKDNGKVLIDQQQGSKRSKHRRFTLKTGLTYLGRKEAINFAKFKKASGVNSKIWGQPEKRWFLKQYWNRKKKKKTT